MPDTPIKPSFHAAFATSAGGAIAVFGAPAPEAPKADTKVAVQNGDAQNDDPHGARAA